MEPDELLVTHGEGCNGNADPHRDRAVAVQHHTIAEHGKGDVISPGCPVFQCHGVAAGLGRRAAEDDREDQVIAFGRIACSQSCTRAEARFCGPCS